MCVSASGPGSPNHLWPQNHQLIGVTDNADQLKKLLDHANDPFAVEPGPSPPRTPAVALGTTPNTRTVTTNSDRLQLRSPILPTVSPPGGSTPRACELRCLAIANYACLRFGGCSVSSSRSSNGCIASAMTA
jgi:hypothetical protein